MDSSRRAVEAYWRSRMIDGVTSDEDKVAPVYKLEEICELLRTSHSSIVSEVTDYILKRLDHKSPIVKQKALRLIKYAVGKSGAEFRREMQRHSPVMKQLFHYKGHPDPLKGDALNKAVRATAHEAISAIFAPDSSKPAVPVEGLNKRIQGFGNTNFEMPMEDKKSFLSEVVGIGSASIKQGLSTIVAAHSTKKNDNGSYKSPNLQRSLTTEMGRDSYEGDGRRESWSSSEVSRSMASGTWSQNSRASKDTEATKGDSGVSPAGSTSCEERLLDTIVTTGGVRLQPTRDAVQVFLNEASKLDALAMSQALESKIQSHLWQVRLKAICVLDAILRKKDEAHFSIIASYFCENRESVVKCSESPQTSLMEKANKVLNLLDGDQSGAKGDIGEPSSMKAVQDPIVLPDLIDTGDLDCYQSEDSTQKQFEESKNSSGSLVDDLLGTETVTSNSGDRNEDDPFADVSFHGTEEKERMNDIFSGLAVDEKSYTDEFNGPTSSGKSDLFDVFGPNTDLLQQETPHDIIAGLSINDLASENSQAGRTSGGVFPGPTYNRPSHQENEASNGTFGSQMASIKASSLLPFGSVQYNIPPNVMFDQAFASQAMNYNAMGNLIAQQQLLFQNLGNMNGGFVHAAGNMGGGYVSPIPDIFQISNNPVQSRGTMANSTKKEETKAFDFISDHLSAARDSKRTV